MHIEESKSENWYAYNSYLFGSNFIFFSGFIFFIPLSLKRIIVAVMCRALHEGTPEWKHGETATWLFIS